MKNKKYITELLILTVCAAGFTGCGKIVQSAVVEKKVAAEMQGSSENGTVETQGGNKNGTVETQDGSENKNAEAAADDAGTTRTTATVPEQVQAPETYQGVPVDVPDVDEITIKRAEPILFGKEDADKWNELIFRVSDEGTVEMEKTENSRDYLVGTTEMDGFPYQFAMFPGYLVGKDHEMLEKSTPVAEVQDREINESVIGVGISLDWARIQPEGDGFLDTQTNTPVEVNPVESLEKAQKSAEEFLQKAGVTDFRLAFCEENEQYMQWNPEDEDIIIPSATFVYERMIDGVPLTYVHENYYPVFEKGMENGSIVSENLWWQEDFRLEYTERLFEARYSHPMKITPYSDEKLFLLPFEEVRQIYENTITEKYKDEPNLKLNKVQLGYMRVREDDNVKKGLLVPVWDFIGTTGEMDYSAYSLLTVDACDGTIRERLCGY